uniref:Conserved oligomeric Golgi complex subunit 7 n=1 Tax=Strigamia maritima TaxID=126957 RepID=T1IJ20_STRMM
MAGVDLSAFGDDNFDAKKWINNAFKTSEAASNKDAFATGLIMKLQLFIQEVNNSLEDLSEQVLQNLPRVIRDGEALSQEATSLQEQMRTVKEDIVNVEKNTAQSMQILINVDTVKSRILSARKALEEADNWTTLSVDIEKIFETGDIHAIAEKLVGMQQSLEILQDVPDYKERALHLENLRNRLEAKISPQLVNSFNIQSTDAALVYAAMFRDINRLPELYQYYHKFHKSQLLVQWKSTVELDSEETVIEWLMNYYDILLSTWHNQVKWITTVFTIVSPIKILSNLVKETLDKLDPPLSFCIDAALKQQSNELLYLINLKQISERFAKSIEAAIQSYDASLLSEDSTHSLVYAIFSPLKPHVAKYHVYEERLLLENLKKIKMNGDDMIDSIHRLGESVSKVIALANEASDRCTEFTYGCLYFRLSSALKTLFSAYISKFNGVVNQLKKNKNETKSKKTLCDDWTIFQNILSVNQISGELYMQIQALDLNLISSQLIAAKKWNYLTEENENINPFQMPPKILLNEPDQKNLKATITKLNQGGDELSLLSEVKQTCRKLCDQTLQSTFNLLFSQIKIYLSELPEMTIWKAEGNALESELPTFSISPLEYITQIGQYLMTVPQHIEPFTMQDNPGLKTVFDVAKFPYATQQAYSEQLADYLLGCIAQGTMEIYLETILEIKELTIHSTKQLATDIDYLCNVLDDLDLKPLDSLQVLLSLLKIPAAEYQSLSEGKPTRLVNAVSSMRNLHKS